MGFFDETGILLGAAPIRPETGQDLGEFGSSGRSGGGFSPGSGGQVTVGDLTIGNYWARANGVIFPLTMGNSVAINQTNSSYGAKLSVNGNIYGISYLLSDSVFIKRDGSDNMVFADAVSGSHTLAELLGTGAGDVMISGTPVVDQLAQWINATTIKGLDISALTLTQSQITGLVLALAGKASTVHNLVDTTNHPVAGLTPGYVLTALTPTSYGFAVVPTNLWDISSDIYGYYTYLTPKDPTYGLFAGHLLITGDSATSSIGYFDPTTAINTASIILTTYGYLQLYADNNIWIQSGLANVLVAPITQFGTYTDTQVILEGIEHQHKAGIHVILRGGNVVLSTGEDWNGGNLYLYGGYPSGAGIAGKIYIGTGSAGTNPLAGAGTGTSVLYYNRTTGEITYGDK
jgi:hypothetical protein